MIWSGYLLVHGEKIPMVATITDASGDLVRLDIGVWVVDVEMARVWKLQGRKEE